MKPRKKWDDVYQILEEYVAIFKKFPEHRTIYKDVKIGVWLYVTQRRAFKNGKLSDEKKALLDTLCPSWEKNIGCGNRRLFEN